MRCPAVSRSVLPSEHSIVSRWTPKRWGKPAGAGFGGQFITIEQCVQPIVSVPVSSLRTASIPQREKHLQNSGLGQQFAVPMFGAPFRVLAVSVEGKKVLGSNFRMAAMNMESEGEEYKKRASGTDSLLDALKGAEMSFTERGQRLPPLAMTGGSDSDALVDTDSGTGVLLEALRALEHNRSPKGNNDTGVGLNVPSAPSSQSTQPSSSVGPSNQSQSRAMVEVGSLVDVVVKKDQVNGRLTRGVVAKILTNSPDHPRGIKVC